MATPRAEVPPPRKPVINPSIPSPAAAAETRGWKVSEEKTAWYIDQLKTHGMKVQPAPAALHAELLKIGERMTVEWAEKAGPDGRAILDAYRKLK